VVWCRLAQLVDRVEHARGARVEQLLLGEAAREHRERLDAGPPGGLAIEGRVADHDTVAAAGFLERRHHEVGLGLGRLDVGGGGPAVRELAGIQEVEVVVDLLLLCRAGQHYGVT
jgi:hypothetical protein